MSKEYTLEMRIEEEKALFSSLNKLLVQIGTAQQQAHDLAIQATCFLFKNRDKLSVLEKMLNSMDNVQGSFRVDSLAYWFTEVAGFKCDVHNNRWVVTRNREPSQHGVQFTYDKHQLNDYCKKDNLRFWIIAPVVKKPLKPIEDVSKATQSAEIVLARGLASGTLDEETIQMHLANMFKRVQVLADSGKVREWTDKFWLENPEYKPVNPDEELKEELIIEELINES